MTTQHASLTGANLHEPKGVATASASQVYFADGAGSGLWTSVYQNNTVLLPFVIDDISTAGFTLVPIPTGMSFVSARVLLEKAITTANANLTFTRSDAASLGTDLTVTYTGSGEGSAFIFTATSNQALSADSYVKIATDGGSTVACKVFGLLILTRTA